jgi:hypothetical protein
MARQGRALRENQSEASPKRAVKKINLACRRCTAKPTERRQRRKAGIRPMRRPMAKPRLPARASCHAAKHTGARSTPASALAIAATSSAKVALERLTMATGAIRPRPSRAPTISFGRTASVSSTTGQAIARVRELASAPPIGPTTVAEAMDAYFKRLAAKGNLAS